MRASALEDRALDSHERMDGALEVTEAELRDFMAADAEPVEADPAFKSRLREQLWEMIREDDMPRQ